MKKKKSTKAVRKARPIARRAKESKKSQPSANTTARLTALEHDLDQLIQTLEARLRKHAARLDALEGKVPGAAAGEGE